MNAYGWGVKQTAEALGLSESITRKSATVDLKVADAELADKVAQKHFKTRQQSQKELLKEIEPLKKRAAENTFKPKKNT